MLSEVSDVTTHGGHGQHDEGHADDSDNKT